MLGCLGDVGALTLGTMGVLGAAGAAPEPAPAPISAIGADGFQADYASTPSIPSPVPFAVSRQGYDASASPVTVSDTLYVTTRVRQPYPNQASLTPLTVALSDYLLSTDTVSGAANNSAEASPKPVANWVSPDRLVVGNSIGGSAYPVELVAFHYYMRAGKQVAAVKFVITDGTTTINVVVSTPTVSGRAGDQNAVIVYALPTTDISTLTNNAMVTVNAEVYPHVGAAASVLKGADVSRSREFSPRYFLKNTTLEAAPPLAYVSPTGNNSTGVISTTAATAKASPYLTMTGALDALQAAYSATTGVDGCRIRIMAGGDIALGSGAAVAKTQKVAALIVERDPDIAMADARLTAGAPRPRLGSGGTLTAPITTGCLIIRNLRVQRTATSAWTGEAGTRLEIFLDNVEFDNNAQASTMFSNSDGYIYGMTLTGETAQFVGPSGNGQWRVWRGVFLNNTGAVRNLEGYLLVGSTIRRTGSTDNNNGRIIAFNKLWGVENTGGPFGATGDGQACVQNVIEYVSATANTQTAISPDNSSAGASNILFANNTLAGFNDHGRSNHCYDEGATPRTTKFCRNHGNIFVQLNTKGDVFVMDGTRLGNLAFEYGVGCTDNFTQFKAANGDLVGQGASFAQQYAGLNPNYGTSNSIRNDPLFTAPASTTSGPTGGAGGGTYTLQSGSPCKAAADAVLPFDLAGTARPQSSRADSRGAYV
ncbi:hypothetical protein [Sphingobium sp. B2]|uniref:hypothetical protein n=1 Tax=Sphingobium sp. B2 TaxID=2583228 RepID=UPI0011A5E5F0|nr:hypothetical protein [Sphingobium sp. B2]